MKTIEERAKEFADTFVVGDSAIIVDILHKVAEESYVKGATEQKAIDIDKACECFELAEDWQAWANCDFEYAKQYFRKVMEE